MLKLWGGLLLLSGGTAICLRRIAAMRQEQRTVWALALMLERMEGTIRWQKLPLPRVLEREAQEKECGKYPRRVLDLMQSGSALQCAWKRMFSELKPSAAADILCRVELGGDVEQVTGALCLGAQQLRQLAQGLASQQGRQERLCVAVSLSLTSLAVILLI